MGLASFEGTVSGLCSSIVLARCQAPAAQLEARQPELVRYVMGQHDRMPDHLRLGFRILTLCFDLMGVAYGGRFHGASHAARWRQIEAWRGAPIATIRDFIRFYESLAVYYWYSPDER